MLKLSFYAFILAGLFSLAFMPLHFSDKQLSSIRGVLVDKATREAIPFSNVALYKDTVFIASTTTNMDGEFYFKNLPAGLYSTKAAYIGYTRQTLKNIAVKDSAMAFIWMELTASGVSLEEIEVVNYKAPLIIDPDTKSGYPRKCVEEAKELDEVASYQPSEKKVLGFRVGRGKAMEQNRSYPVDKEANTEAYATLKDNAFKNAKKDPLSTFSIDVDKAAYSNVRRFINRGSLPPADAVRVEEMINYFTYNYPQPKPGQPFSISTQYADCPWNTKHQLVHIGIQGKEFNTGKLPANNLVFLLDVSGSMEEPDKLPLLKSGLNLLINQLREEDHVAIVVYAGAAGVVLPSTRGDQKEKIRDAIDNLSAGGSTAGGEGIVMAYALAKQNFLSKGNNRVILATDGDFNVGVTSDDALVKLIEKQKEDGVFLTVLGFGTGNYKDSKMEQLADKGNGNYAYIDNILEAKKVLVKEMGGTLFTIAKDVKIQVEFNPAKVKAYRLVGYENRLLNNEDFNDDKKDAGELGAGHNVTAIYEIIAAGSTEPVASVDSLKYQQALLTNKVTSDEIMTIKFRYKEPTGSVSKLITEVVSDKKLSFAQASEDCRFAATVAEFGMLLRDSEFKGNADFKKVLAMARASKGKDDEGYRAEFIRLVEMAELLKSNVKNGVVVEE